MSEEQFSIQRLNEIFKNTIDSIQGSKDEIFDIVENSLNECKEIEERLSGIQIKIVTVIEDVEVLEKLSKKSRQDLSIKSSQFDKYDEDTIKDAYDKANLARVNLLLKREEEKNLIERRKELELRLKNSYDIYLKAERINSQMSVAFDYLIGNVEKVAETVEDIEARQDLNIRIIEAQEEERHRLARDIHDGPAQSMANIILKAELCERLIEKNRDEVGEEIKKLKNFSKDTLKELRKTIYDLRPMSLDDLGLIPTIERYLLSFEDETNMDVNLKVLGSFNNLESVVQITVFRVMQESLSNIKKHAKANSVSVILERVHNKLNFSIIDDGIGFSKNQEVDKDRDPLKGGFGLISIKERVNLVNGNIEINSYPGEGTRINLSIPLKEEVNYE